MIPKMRLPLVLALGLLALASLPVAAITNEQKSMLDQLDLLDQQEFVAQIEKAQACTRLRDFACAEKRLAKAAKYTTNSQDKGTLRLAHSDLAAERAAVIEEGRQRAAEQRRIAEEERRMAEEERRMREQQEQAERETERNSGPSTADLIQQFGNEFLKNYEAELASSRAAKAQAYEMARQRQATYEAENARKQAQFAQQRAQMEADRTARQTAAAAARANAERQVAAAQATRAREAQARQEQQARQREQAQARLDQQARQREQAQAQAKAQAEAILREQARKQELAVKRAEEERKKQAEAQAAKQAEEQYLKSVAAGIRLVATKCPGGEGKYYATGSMPRIRPEVVSCIDVRFRAYCPGSAAYSEGTARNFIGMAGCFGDTYDISPTPPCDVKEVRIQVLEAMPGCN